MFELFVMPLCGSKPRSLAGFSHSEICALAECRYRVEPRGWMVGLANGRNWRRGCQCDVSLLITTGHSGLRANRPSRRIDAQFFWQAFSARIEPAGGIAERLAHSNRPSPVAQPALRRQTSKVGAGC